MRRFHASEGFTLIELSVVLVVIGLIIGTVLVGASILQNARITAAVNALQSIQSAVSTYNQNYNALPGDDPLAEQRFSSLGVATRGGGDGVIGVTGALQKTFDNVTGSEGSGAGESANVWQHLRAAGLVRGPISSTTPPSNPFGGVIGVQNGAFSGNQGISLGTNVICASGIPGKAASVIDQRLDDGSALTGNVRGGTDVTAAPVEYTNDSTAYTVCFPL